MVFLSKKALLGVVVAVVLFGGAAGIFSFLKQPHGDVKGLAKYDCTLCSESEGCKTYDSLVASKEQCAVEQYKIDSSSKDRH